MRLYFVRHGESIWNLEKYLQGTLDVPLSETGMHQAELLWSRLRNIPFDVVVCSPLSRAQQTADAILAHQEELSEKIIDERLTGRYYGVYQGRPYAEMLWGEQQTLGQIYKQAEGKETVEPRADVADRAISCMHEIIEKYPNKRVLIVTHNEVKASAIQQLIHPDMPNDYYSSSVSILEYENDMWDYISLNDISHLLPDERVD